MDAGERRSVPRHGPVVTLARAALLFTLLANGAFGAEPAGGEPAAIARQTVAAALGIPAADVRILRVEAREFRDGSLDCPQTGTAYAQVITPGHQVLAEAGGRRFDVRIAGTAGRICHRRRPAAPGQAPPPARETGAAARADLAAHLGIPPADVAVTFLRRLRPGEAVPGCGVPCPADALQTTCPVGIRLKAGDRGYEYVSGPEGPRPCPPIAPR